MKILFLIDSLHTGGKERRLVDLIKMLSGCKDIEIELILFSLDIYYTKIFDVNIKVHYIIRKFKKDPAVFLKIYKICKIFNPDIIHSFHSMSSIYAFPIAKLLKIKFINAMITDAPRTIKILSESWIRAKFSFPFSDIILSNSNAGLMSYKVSGKKGYCIHNGFDFSRIEDIKNKSIVRKEFGINNEPVVGMVASFSDKKDYDTFILAAAKILKKRKNTIFLAVGDGKNFIKCKNLAGENRNRIKFLGERKDIEDIVNICDICVLSTYTEGISNSVMEYMALGKPVIVSDGGGTKELVINGRTGFLNPPRNIDKLVEKIEYLLENPDIASNIGKAGKQRLFEHFSLEKMVNNTLNLYNSLLNNP